MSGRTTGEIEVGGISLLDGVEILSAFRFGRRLVAIGLVAGFVLAPQATTNLLYGQSIQAAVSTFAPIAEHFGLKCGASSAGWFAPTTIDCA